MYFCSMERLITTNRPFCFKQFTVNHCRSSMKVGVDGVLIGAWGEICGNRGLDVGCGCGLIALQLAQRNRNAMIDAIDIHSPSIEEAKDNFGNSPWAERINAFHCDITAYSLLPVNQGKYDFIVSNPPFFNSGLKQIQTSRELARHEGEFTFRKLFEAAERLLKDNGSISVILPASRRDQIKQETHLSLGRECLVSNGSNKEPKRVLLTFYKCPVMTEPELESLYIRNEQGDYSEAYKSLTRDFYLNF